MQQINLYSFYELGAKLHALFDSRAQNRVADLFGTLTEIQVMLDNLIKGENVKLDAAKPEAKKLLDKIGSIFNRYFIDPATKQLKNNKSEDRLDAHELSTLMSMVEKFEHALGAEMARVPSYIAMQRGIYSMRDLIENSRQIFSSEILPYIPAVTLNEFDTAGRAMGFGLDTTAGIHIIRAIEIALRHYCDFFAGSAAVKGERNYALLLKKLHSLADDTDAKVKPNARVILMLTQVKENYRDAILAPESSINAEEATLLFGMASNLLALMAKDIQIHSKEKTSSRTNKPEDHKEEQAYEFQSLRSR